MDIQYGNNHSILLDNLYPRPESRWRRTILPLFAGAIPHYLRVDGTAHTVYQFSIELRQGVALVSVGCVCVHMRMCVCVWQKVVKDYFVDT